MKKSHFFLTILFLLYFGCDDENSCDVELWGECYSIADTDSLNFSMQQLTGPIPPGDRQSSQYDSFTVMV